MQNSMEKTGKRLTSATAVVVVIVVVSATAAIVVVVVVVVYRCKSNFQPFSSCKEMGVAKHARQAGVPNRKQCMACKRHTSPTPLKYNDRCHETNRRFNCLQLLMCMHHRVSLSMETWLVRYHTVVTNTLWSGLSQWLMTDSVTLPPGLTDFLSAAEHSKVSCHRGRLGMCVRTQRTHCFPAGDVVHCCCCYCCFRRGLHCCCYCYCCLRKGTHACQRSATLLYSC